LSLTFRIVPCFTLILIVSLCASTISFSKEDTPQTAEISRLVKALKKGSIPSRLEAADNLASYGAKARRAYPDLLKAMKRARKAEDVTSYLSAILAVTDDHEDAFELFLQNWMQ